MNTIELKQELKDLWRSRGIVATPTCCTTVRVELLMSEYSIVNDATREWMESNGLTVRSKETIHTWSHFGGPDKTVVLDGWNDFECVVSVTLEAR